MSGCPPCPDAKVVARNCPQPCQPCPQCVLNCPEPQPASLVCPEVPKCPDCICPPPKVTVKQQPPEPGRWLAAISGLYQEDPGLGAGLGYRWGNGVTLIGQALYLDREGCKGFDGEGYQHYRGMPVEYEYSCPGCDHDKWGFGATVLIPLGGK